MIVLLVAIALLAGKGLKPFMKVFGLDGCRTGCHCADHSAGCPITQSGSLIIGLTGRFFAIAILLAATIWVAARAFDQDDLVNWIAETWKFVKQIFPLLILGVFLAGIAKG